MNGWVVDALRTRAGRRGAGDARRGNDPALIERTFEVPGTPAGRSHHRIGLDRNRRGGARCHPASNRRGPGKRAGNNTSRRDHFCPPLPLSPAIIEHPDPCRSTRGNGGPAQSSVGAGRRIGKAWLFRGRHRFRRRQPQRGRRVAEQERKRGSGDRNHLWRGQPPHCFGRSADRPCRRAAGGDHGLGFGRGRYGERRPDFVSLIG